MKTSLKTSSLISLLLGCAAAVGAAPLSLVAGDRVVEIHGAAGNERFGRPLFFIDLDHDGYDDLVAGSDRSDFANGERRSVYIFRGGPTFNTRGLIDLATDNADSVILGELASTSLTTALAAGDVNSDGIQDLVLVDPGLTVVGISPAVSRVQAGAAYVLFGSQTFFDTPVRDFENGDWDVKILGAEAGDNTGGSSIFGGGISQSLACGDFDSDGFDDIAIGANLSNGSGPATSGAVRIVKGRAPFAPGTVIDLASQANYRIYGDDTDDELGSTLVAGDVNGDGIDDLIISVPYAGLGNFTSEGYVYILFGRVNFPATINLGTTAPSAQISHTEDSANLGEAIGLGDVNGDTINDIVVTAKGWDGVGGSSDEFGAVYVFLGRTTWPVSMTTDSADSSLFGYSNSESIGNTLAVGDVNADGFADYFFTARDTGRPGFNIEGRTFGKFGGAAALGTYFLEQEQVDLIINGNQSGLQLGDYIATGDPDGDHAADIAIAAPFFDGTTGRVYVFDRTPPPTFGQRWMLY